MFLCLYKHCLFLNWWMKQTHFWEATITPLTCPAWHCLMQTSYTAFPTSTLLSKQASEIQRDGTFPHTNAKTYVQRCQRFVPVGYYCGEEWVNNLALMVLYPLVFHFSLSDLTDRYFEHDWIIPPENYSRSKWPDLPPSASPPSPATSIS